MKAKMLVFAAMGFELVGLIVASLYIGQVIDQYFGWSGIGVAFMMVTCLVGWFVHLIYLLKRLMDDNSDGQS